MAINVDTSKPLSDEVIADLRTRLPESLVQHYIDQATLPKDEQEKKPAAKRGGGGDTTPAKDDELLK